MRLHGRSKAREYARPNEIAGVLDMRMAEGDSKKEGSEKEGSMTVLGAHARGEKTDV
jgi:hypothetical protein